MRVGVGEAGTGLEGGCPESQRTAILVGLTIHVLNCRVAERSSQKQSGQAARTCLSSST